MKFKPCTSFYLGLLKFKPHMKNFQKSRLNDLKSIVGTIKKSKKRQLTSNISILFMEG